MWDESVAGRARDRRRELLPQVDEQDPALISASFHRRHVPTDIFTAQAVAVAVLEAVDPSPPAHDAAGVTGRVGHQRNDAVALEREGDALPATEGVGNVEGPAVAQLSA